MNFKKIKNLNIQRLNVNPNPSSDYHKKLSDIDFDVAVTVSEGKSVEGSGGLSVMGVSLGGKGGSEQNSFVSRIKFSIPVSYP